MKKLIRSLFKIKILETLLLKINSGKEYGALTTKLTPNHNEYQKNTTRHATRNGIKFELDISDIVDWFIYFDFKEPSRDKLLSLINKNSTVLDIGANIGQVALQCAQRANAGQVHAFEPFPKTFKKLEKHLTLNAFDNLSIHNIGLGNAAGELFFQTNFIGNPGMNRITNNEKLASTKISIVRLDNFMVDNNIQQVDLIKIDVEGFEFEVLKGAQETIQKYHPKLFIELDDENLKLQNSSAKELVSWLKAYNYQITNADTSVNVESTSDFTNCHFDIICV